MRNIPKKEDLFTEFKSDTKEKNGLPDSELIDAVVGMTNAEGGILYLGVEDDGEITGLTKQHKDAIGVMALIANSTVPTVSTRAEIITENKKDILRIEVPKARTVTATSSGKTLRRRLKFDGSPEAVPLFPYEIPSRLSELSLLDFSAQPLEGGQCIHLAPPADRVQILISDLFKWLQDADDHLLIKSCVFHYEFEFIHPFDDGNGRMGRLWQSLILGKLHPLFLQLPVENIVYTHQQDYYNAINKSTEEAQCGSFIEFMLEKILETLKSHQGGKLSKTNIALTERQQKILELLNENVALNVATNVALNSNNLAEKLGVSRKTIERDMTVLQEKGLVQRVGSNKTGHWELV